MDVKKGTFSRECANIAVACWYAAWREAHPSARAFIAAADEVDAALLGADDESASVALLP